MRTREELDQTRCMSRGFIVRISKMLPVASRKARERGKTVRYIQKLTRPSRGKRKSIPVSGSKEKRPWRPCDRSSGVTASSTRRRYDPRARTRKRGVAGARQSAGKEKRQTKIAAPNVRLRDQRGLFFHRGDKIGCFTVRCAVWLYILFKAWREDTIFLPLRVGRCPPPQDLRGKVAPPT